MEEDFDRSRAASKDRTRPESMIMLSVCHSLQLCSQALTNYAKNFAYYILFFCAHGSAYYSSMPAYYSNLLSIELLLQRININTERVVCSLLETTDSGKLKRKLPQPMAEAGKFSQ